MIKKLRPRKNSDAASLMHLFASLGIMDNIMSPKTEKCTRQYATCGNINSISFTFAKEHSILHSFNDTFHK